MNEGYGHEVPPAHAAPTHRPVTRWLVIVNTPQGRTAHLLQADRTQVAEFDASSEEVMSMMATASPRRGAGGSEWDAVLGGYSGAQRAVALVYELPA